MGDSSDFGFDPMLSNTEAKYHKPISRPDVIFKLIFYTKKQCAHSHQLGEIRGLHRTSIKPKD